MKTRIVIGITLLVLSSLLKAQESNFEKFERYFTWDPDSTSIYANPDSKSEELIKLPYGTELVKLEEYLDKDTIVFIGELHGNTDHSELGGGYSFDTFWVKVQYQGILGYSLNAEIINFPPMTYAHQVYSIEVADLGMYFSGPIKYSVHKAPLDNTSTLAKFTTHQFPDGSLLLYKEYGGCIDRELIPREVSAAQAYMMLKTWHYVYPNEKEAAVNHGIIFQGNFKKRFNFKSSILIDFQNPFIEVRENGQFAIGSSVCN